MAHWAIRGLGFPCRFVSAEEIAQGCLMRKHCPILLVPGGSARQKARALGARGLEAIRAWTAGGGLYLGFCGGAGLALATADPDYGLGLCPWRRHAYSERLYHLISGHILARVPFGLIAAPVWWPGRFEPDSHADVTILARYHKPADDLWLADLPLAAIPTKIRLNWQQSGFLAGDLHLPAGHPLTVTGAYGQGRYLLSYAHLETPASPQANAWLAGLLREYGGLSAVTPSIPDWNFSPLAPAAADCSFTQAIKKFYRQLSNTFSLGYQLGIFFKRANWLTGWLPGVQGMLFNHLASCLFTLQSMSPTADALAFWQDNEETFSVQYHKFISDAQAFLCDYKLKNTLAANNCNMLDEEYFHNKKTATFGLPMNGGGLAQSILDRLEKMIFISQPPHAEL